MLHSTGRHLSVNKEKKKKRDTLVVSRNNGRCDAERGFSLFTFGAGGGYGMFLYHFSFLLNKNNASVHHSRDGSGPTSHVLLAPSCSFSLKRRMRKQAC